MIQAGMCSITFRKKTPEEVIKIVSGSGLSGIEWGGDIHVPPTENPDRIREIGDITRDNGIEVSSYGSYYRVLRDDGKKEDFEYHLDAASLLRTDTLRVWCGGGDSADASETKFLEAAEQVIELAGKAAGRGITIAFEFHRGGLTDTVESTLKLLEMIDQENVKTYYQIYPKEKRTPSQELVSLFPCLLNIHCYHWDGLERLLLKDGEEEWNILLQTARDNGFSNWVLLEFTKNDSEENFLNDAAVLAKLAGQD